MDSALGQTYDQLIEKNFIGSTSLPLIRRECLDEVGMFTPDMPASQDLDLWKLAVVLG